MWDMTKSVKSVKVYRCWVFEPPTLEKWDSSCDIVVQEMDDGGETRKC